VDERLKLFANLLEEEAKGITLATAKDTPIGDYITPRDFIYFITRIIFSSTGEGDTSMSVGAWLDHKKYVASSAESISSTDEWIRFCQESTLITRAYVSLTQGKESSSLYSGSGMNWSVSNLIARSFPDFSSSGEGKSTSSGGSRHTMSRPKAGGSSLHAVSELLGRPWQQSLPLTIDDAEGLSAIFGYTNLSQMMAHVAMNCCEKTLEPFFAIMVNLGDGGDERRTDNSILNVRKCLAVQSESCTVADALILLESADFFALIDPKQQLINIILIDDVLDIITSRLVVEDRVEEDIPVTADRGSVPSLSSIMLADQLASIDSHCFNNASVMSIDDFPISFSAILQKVLLNSRGNMIAVVGHEGGLVGVITVRDIWEYVMNMNG
jgi:CBS domain-containing protein